jgi:hypothetical protein
MSWWSRWFSIKCNVLIIVFTAKCYVATLHRALNFGAALQAYALQRSILEIGGRSNIIDFGPVVPDYAYHTSGRTLIKPAKLAFYILQLREWRCRARRFYAFQKARMSLTDHYPDLAALQAADLAADALICGSDQIWNPRLPFDPVFFLQFGSASCRRIAYAPSFGTPEVAPHLLPQLRDYLGAFDALSCREKSGVDLMENLTGREVFHAVDPTLLLEASAWKELALQAETIKLPEHYILVYALEDSPVLAEAVLIAQKETKLPIVTLSVALRRPGHHYNHLVRSAGPLEFLSLLLHARTVITNSMHGTMFSLIFEKRALFPRHMTSGERIRDLFARLNTPNNNPIVSLSEQDSTRLRPLRQKLATASRCFLAGALHGRAIPAGR